MQFCILFSEIVLRFCWCYMATHKCVINWPASHAMTTNYPETGYESFLFFRANCYSKASLRREGDHVVVEGVAFLYLLRSPYRECFAIVARTPSVAYGASSLAEGAFLTVSSLAFNLLSPYRQSLFRTTPLWRGFRFTIQKRAPCGALFIYSSVIRP